MENTDTFIYWTKDPPGKRRIIQDTAEARADAIRKGAMFFTNNSFSEPYENSGAPEPHRWGDVPFDFDGAGALKDARDLALTHLPHLYGLDPYDLRYFMSGKKGLHIEIPAECFGASDGDQYLPKIYKRVATELKTAFDLSTLDMSVYNMKSGKLWRIPNVKRSNDRYKVPIELEELRDLSEADLIELTKAPREIDVINDDPPDVCHDLKSLYDEAKEFVHQEQKERVESDPLTDEEKARISKEIPPCVRYVLTACPSTDKSNFNKLVLNLCKYFITSGHDLKGSIESARSFIEKYPHSETYATKEHRLQHWKELFTYLSGDADSDFNCSYMRGMGFPGNAFECKTCPMTAQDDTGWPEPEPIKPQMLPVVPMEDDMIPDPLLPMVKDISRRMSVPMEYVAVPLIIVFGSIIGTGCSIKPKRKDDWSIVPNLWGGISGPPSKLKTPSMDEAISKTVGRLETEASEDHKQTKTEWMTEQQAATMKKDVLKSEYKRALKAERKDTFKEKYSDTILEELAELDDLECPHERRYKVNDCSIEKMVELLSNNAPRGLLYYRDELVGLFRKMDKPGHEQDRAFLIESWNGKGSHTDDRIGRGTVRAENLCVSLVGTIQPGRLVSYIRAALSQDANDGFPQRLQMMVHPDPVRTDYVDEWPNKEAKERVYLIAKALAEEDFIGSDFDQDDSSMRFSDEAQEIFKTWYMDLQNRLDDNEDDHPAIIEHLGKYRSLMPSLALIFHLVDYAAGTAEGPVSKTATIRACAWCQYLESHARRLYGLALDCGQMAAAALSKKIEGGKLEVPFTVPKIQRKRWGQLTDNSVIKDAVSILADAGWIRSLPVVKNPVGGKPPAPEYEINPKVPQG